MLGAKFMVVFSWIFNVVYQFMDSFSFLILSVMGLAIIFGMMGIINLAHGEFIMLGAYITTLFAKSGVPLIVAIILGSIGVGIFGLIIEKIIVSRLYGRPLDSIVATWGISLLMSQGMLVLLGPSLQGLTTPLGRLHVGGNIYSVYRIILTLVSFLLLALIYWLFTHTSFGLKSRATMQNQAIAQALGTNTKRMYTMTFVIGSMLAGFCGGLYAPTIAVTPRIGQAFQTESFVTVIVGGGNPLVGSFLSGSVLGAVQSILSIAWGTFFGRMGLLIVAILTIRIFPKGLSGLVERKVLKGSR